MNMREGVSFIHDMEPAVEKMARAYELWMKFSPEQRFGILDLLTHVSGFDPATSWDGKGMEELMTSEFLSLPNDLKIELGDCINEDGTAFEL